MRVIWLQRLLPPHDAAGPAFGPADAKTGIQQGPKNRQKKGRYCPAQGSTRIMLGKQRVAHSDPRQDVGNQQPYSLKKKQHFCPTVGTLQREVRTVTGVARPWWPHRAILVSP